MADFTISIPDDQVDRVVDALCAVGGYAGTDDRKARRDYAREVVIRYVRATVMQVERNQAVADAVASVSLEPVPID